MQNVFPKSLFAIGILCAVVPSAGVLQADGGNRDLSQQTTSRSQAKRSKSQVSRTKSAGRVSLTPGREAAAMTFRPIASSGAGGVAVEVEEKEEGSSVRSGCPSAVSNE